MSSSFGGWAISVRSCIATIAVCDALCRRTCSQKREALNSSITIAVPPTVIAAMIVIPWPLTWKSGSAVRQRSFSSSQRQWTVSRPARRQLAWVSITAFGFEVVPEVKSSSATSSPPTVGRGGGSSERPGRSSKAKKPGEAPAGDDRRRVGPGGVDPALDHLAEVGLGDREAGLGEADHVLELTGGVGDVRRHHHRRRGA